MPATKTIQRRPLTDAETHELDQWLDAYRDEYEHVDDRDERIRDMAEDASHELVTVDNWTPEWREIVRWDLTDRIPR